MASAFNLTAQINLRGPTNLRPIIAQIKRELGTINADVKVNVDARSAKSIDNITARLRVMNSVLTETRNHTQAVNQALGSLSSGFTALKSSSSGAASGMNQSLQTMKQTAKVVQVARTEMQEFGKQSYLAIKRFAAFSFVTTGIFALTNAITAGLKAFINFDKEMIRLQQVTGKGAIGLKSLEAEITRLATTLGVSSESLTNVATTLAQAGLNANDTRVALEALAKTELAPSFDDITQTTEGAIAALRQFELQTSDLEDALGSINSVAAAFAVESSDIITAIQRTGGVFAAASKGVSQGKDALNEFIAVFTSVRATTRESAETIATGLRTIFTRIQRARTIDQLKEFGVELTDLEGKFVGPYEAIKRLSSVLGELDPRDLRFSQIVEELGGFRQIGKVIPLIQQFATAQEALKIAQKGQGSLTEAAATAQKSLANQIAKVREQFLALVRDVGKSTVFQGLFKIVTNLASSLISLASAFKPILPILGILGAVKGASALTQFASGFFGSMNKGGGSKSVGENLGSSVTGAKEKERADATNRATEAIKANTAALNQLTSAVQSLTNKIGASGTTTLNSGGQVRKFAGGGYVPGTGNRDTVPAMLTPGEFVIRKKAVETIGADKLHKMNKYAGGGTVRSKKGSKGYNALAPIIVDVDDRNIQASHVGMNLGRLNPKEVETYTSMPARRGFRSKKFDPEQTMSAGITASETFKLGLPTIANQNMKTGKPGVTSGAFRDWIRKNPELLFSGRGTIPQKALQVSPQIFAETFANALGAANSGVLFDKDLSTAFESVRGLLSPKYLESRSGKVDLFSRPAGEERSQIRHEGFDIKKISDRFLNGGFIQKFADAGLVEIAKQKGKTLQETLVEEIIALGRIDGIKKALKVPKADRKYDSLLRLSNINAGKNIEEAVAVIDKVLEQRRASGQVEAEAIAQATKFGLVGIQPFDYSKQFGPEDIGGRSTYITARGLSSKYSDIVQEMQAEMSGASTKFAEKIQMRNIFGGSGPLAFDFDETLVSGADIFDASGNIDIAGYSDLERVAESLKSGKLTRLGEELKSRLSQFPDLLNNIRVLTARPQSNAPLLADRLKQLGLNIPENKIKGVTGPQNKINDIGELETLIDDRIKTIEALKAAGKKGIAYSPIISDLSGPAVAAGQASIEGAVLESTLAKLGAPLKPDAQPGRPIDYPDGLGTAAQYFGIDPNIPTEVKRTIDNSSLYRTRKEIERAYNENQFKLGGRVYDLQNGTGLGDSEFNELVRYGNTNEFTEQEFKDYLAQYLQKKSSKKGLMMNTEQLRQVLLSGTRTQQASQKQMDLAKQLSGEPDAKYNPKYDNARKPFAVGGVAEADPAKQKIIADLQAWEQKNNIKFDSDYFEDLVQKKLLEQQKKPKDFGKIALRKDANSITATYFKNDTRSGQVSAFKMRDYLYYVGLSQATQGYGPRLYDAVMETATEQGAMLTSDRGSVSGAAKKVWEYYFKNRGDVKKTPLKFEDWTRNQANVDPKLHGREETWPPATDPAWILQTGYSKTPSLINDPGSVIRMDKQAQSSATTALQFFQSKPMEFAKGGSAEDTVPALLTPGEFVINKKAAKKIGYAQLHKMNKADKIQGFNKGGGVGMIQRFADGGEPIDILDSMLKVDDELRKLKAQRAQLDPKISTKEIEELDKKIEEARQKFDDLSSQAESIPAPSFTAQSAPKGFFDRFMAMPDRPAGGAAPSGTSDPVDPILSAATTASATAAIQAAPPSGGNKPPIVPPPVPPLGGNPPTPPNTAAQQADAESYFQYRAGKAGLSGKQYEKDLASKIVSRSKDLQTNLKSAQTEGIAEFQGMAPDIRKIKNNTSEEAARKEYTAAVEDATQKLKDINPTLNEDELKKASEALIQGLLIGEASLNDIIDNNESLSKALKGSISAEQARAAATAELEKTEKFSAGELDKRFKTGSGAQQIKRQEFIQSEVGQKFGGLSERMPDLLESFSKTRVGKGTIKAADVFSGTNLTQGLEKRLGESGKFIGDKINALGGPMVVLGGAVAMAADQITRNMNITDPGTAGAIGAAGGAGAGLASGALLGAQIAGPVGAMIAGVGGAIIGGIKGYFDAFNTKLLENNLKALDKSANELDIALKKLTIASNDATAAEVAKAAVGDQGAIKSTAQQAQLGFGPKSPARGWLEFFRQEPTGLISSVTGGGQEAEARQAIFANIERTLGAFEKLGERNLARSSGNQVRDVLNQAAEAEKTGGAGARQEVLARSNQTYQMMARQGFDPNEIFQAMGVQRMRQQGKDPTTASREELIAQGKELAAVEAEGALKQKLLAESIRETSIRAENLIDIFRRVTANLERFGNELNNIKNNTMDAANAMGGRAATGPVDRTNEQILSNVSAYSQEEINAVADQVSGLSGDQQLGNQVKAAKILQDELPKILKNTTGQDVEAVTDQLKDVFKAGNIEVPPDLFSSIEDSLREKLGGRTEVSMSDIAGETDVLEIAAKVQSEALKVASDYLKRFNDALDLATEFAKNYASAIDQADQMYMQSANVRLQADLKLAEALGNTASLAEQNAPFENQVRGLSKGVIAGGSTDPNKIFAAMQDAIAERGRMQETVKQNAAALSKDPANLELQKQYTDSAKALEVQNTRINNANKSLEALANDGSAAANALGKIQEQQRQVEGFGNFLEKVATADFDQLFQMRRESAALVVAQNSGPEFMRNVENRQLAFAGLNAQKELYTPEEFRNKRADLLTKFYQSQGFKGQDKVPALGGMTLDEAMKRIRGGASEDDPNVKAYREATARQAAAADQLGNAAMLVAQEFNKGLQDVMAQVATLPDTMKEAEISAKPEEKPAAEGVAQDQKLVMDEASLQAIRDGLQFKGELPTLGLDPKLTGQLDTTIQSLTTAITALGVTIGALTVAIGAYAASQAMSGKTGMMGGLGRMLGFGKNMPTASPTPMGAPGSIPGMGKPAAGAPAGAPGAGGGWLSFLGKALAAAEIGRGAYVGATADTSTNKELTQGFMGENIGTGFNALTGALTGNTGQSQIATMAGIDESASYTQGAAGNLLGSAEAAGRGAAIGYQFGGPTGALVGAIAGLAGDVAKNGALLVQAIGDVTDQVQKNADAEARNKRIEEQLRTNMNSTNTERFGQTAGAALSQLSPEEQIRARDEANLRVRLQKAKGLKEASGTDTEKLQTLGEDTGRFKSLNELISYLEKEAQTSAEQRSKIVTKEAGIFTSKQTRGADSPEFLSAVDALVASQTQTAEDSAKTAKMADEATKPGSIYTHDIKTEGLLGQLVSLMGGKVENTDDTKAENSIISTLKNITMPTNIAGGVMGAGKELIGKAVETPQKLMGKGSDLIKTLLNPKELTDSISESISSFSLSDILGGEKTKTLDDSKLGNISSLANIIPKTLLDKFGLGTDTEATGATEESCECKILKEILAVLKSTSINRQTTPTTSTPAQPVIPAPTPPGVTPGNEQLHTPAELGKKITPDVGKLKSLLESNGYSGDYKIPSLGGMTIDDAMNSLNSQNQIQQPVNIAESKAASDAASVKKQLSANNTDQPFVEGEDAVTRAEKQYAPTAERKAFVMKELKDARQRQRIGQKLPTDDSVISASSFELKNISDAEKTKKREQYLLKKAPKFREKYMTKKEKESGQAEKLADQPQLIEEPKALSPYQQMLKGRRDSYLSEKQSRRQAYLSRFRPEVRESMMTEEEKAARDKAQTQATAIASAAQENQAQTRATPEQLDTIRQGLASPPGGQSLTQAQNNLTTDIQRLASPANGPTGLPSGGPTGDGGFQIQLDPNAQSFIDNLQNTFNSFNTYIDKLATVAATIPSKIELTGNYTLDVQISGAAAFDALEGRMKELAVSLVEPKLNALRDEVSAAMGGDKVKSSASMGNKMGPKK